MIVKIRRVSDNGDFTYDQFADTTEIFEASRLTLRPRVLATVTGKPTPDAALLEKLFPSSLGTAFPRLVCERSDPNAVAIHLDSRLSILIISQASQIDRPKLVHFCPDRACKLKVTRTDKEVIFDRVATDPDAVSWQERLEGKADKSPVSDSGEPNDEGDAKDAAALKEAEAAELERLTGLSDPALETEVVEADLHWDPRKRAKLIKQLAKINTAKRT